MREIRSSGSVEGVMSNHDPYSDRGLGGDGRNVPQRETGGQARETGGQAGRYLR